MRIAIFGGQYAVGSWQRAWSKGHRGKRLKRLKRLKNLKMLELHLLLIGLVMKCFLSIMPTIEMRMKEPSIMLTIEMRFGEQSR